ncbi:ATP-binding protein [Altererythrobacter arenosus]|uniref:histidine kinase n=1 Tax=Altererythrobacter arenosus TaxID=3032592 RepID=A0ABY8FYJ6_9SPHN|nr:ATP-binding protein [Altererythrobacter sp. CAU 1644]WFL78451.1 ATP-binding protein [Altererythrobacter sp. CAU 1644]
MARLLPRSLLGQVMLVLALGLMVGQAVSGAMLYRAAEQRRETALVHSLAFRIVAALEGPANAERIARHQARRLNRDGGGHRPHDMRGRARLGVELSQVSPLGQGGKRLPELEATIRDLLDQHDLELSKLVVLRRSAGDDPFLQDRPRFHERLGGEGWQRRQIYVAGIAQDGAPWRIVRVPEPRAPRAIVGSILLQTLVTFVVLVALLFPMLRRITRPLASLTARVDDFARNPDRPVALAESGPEDIRHLIAAHNAMEARIAAMLDEKDVMLGAIGHDLKTPLAALRVRIENVADETQRLRMAESIEDITRTLDDILNLARVGRSTDPLEKTDLAALLSSLVEEYEDMGEPVEMAETDRVVAQVRATWLRRAVRNLIGNALRYGGTARVSLAAEGDRVTIRVDDDGPGIPEDQISAMLEPFARGEASRNRATGGAGLGLTLARAIAEQHGGALSLANRAEGGLRAGISLPR